MKQKHDKRYETYYRILLSGVGISLFVWASWHLLFGAFRIESVTLAIISLILSRVTFTRIATIAITNSDAFIYLSFLLCGMEEAILVTALLTFSETIQFARGKRLLIAFNTAVMCCTVFLATFILNKVFGPLHSLLFDRKTFFIYVLALICLALWHGVINLGLMLTSLALRPGKLRWLHWIKEHTWSLVTPLSGILLAAIVNTLVHYYGFWAIFSIIPLLIAAHAISYPYVKNINNARRHAEEINAMHERTLEAFITAVDSKKQVASRRVERLQVYARELARLLNLPAQESKALQTGALLHDIGNVAVPDFILNKPGKLSVAEHERMQLHTVVGAQLLEQIQLPYPLAPIVRHHHERWDGTGYPDGLAGEAIPLTARIMAVLDGFESRCEDRQYRKAFTRQRAIEDLQAERGKAYDPQIIDLLLDHLVEFEAQLSKQEQERQATQFAEEIEKMRETKFLPDPFEEILTPPTFVQTIHESRQLTQGNYALFEIAEKLAGVLDVKQAMAIFTKLLDSVIPFNAESDTCVLYWLDEEQRQARVEFAAGMQAEKFAELHIKPGEGVTGWTLANQSYFANTDPALDIFALELSCKEGAGLSGYQTVAVFPVMKNDELFGALALYSRTLKSFDNDQIYRLQRATELLSDVLSSAHKHAAAQQQALTDEMTGLPNARYLRTYFTQEKTLSSINHLTLLLTDLSGFRQVTEKAENKRTDEIMREIAGLIKGQLRKSDTLVHYWGDQFIVLLPNVSAETASQISARIQSAIIEARSFLLSVDDVMSGLSLGQVRFGEDGESLDELLNAAQIRLQADKAARHSYAEKLAA
jgi:diguanylate cyclase (GGDEF)-like protein/putative nucleotidyltransferase with HDIG domain